MTRLPIWANTPETRALIATVVDSQPNVRVTLGGMTSGHRHVAGQAAKAVRDAYNEWLSGQIEFCSDHNLGDAEYYRRREAVIAVEDADRLLERMMDEALVLTEVEHIAPGAHRPVAACAGLSQWMGIAVSSLEQAFREFDERAARFDATAAAIADQLAALKARDFDEFDRIAVTQGRRHAQEAAAESRS